MSETKRIKKYTVKAAGLILGFAVAALCLIPSAAFAQDGQSEQTEPAIEAEQADSEYKAEPVKVKTEIEGVLTVRNCRADSTLTDTIKITNGAGRKVYLKKWNKAQGRWYTRSTYQLKNTEKPQSIKLMYPENWSTTTYGTWKVYIPAGTDAAGEKTYSAEEVKVRTIAYNRYDLPLKAKSACIMDEYGYIIYRKNSTVKRPMASTTKMMTATLVIEKGLMNRTVTVSKWAAGTAWGILNLKGGERFKMSSLMHALLISSSNEAANAIAQSVAGTKVKFVSMMNTRAKELGLKNTHYANAHGLEQDGHYSTARDVTRLLMHVSSYKEFRTIAGKQNYRMYNLSRSKSWNLETTNPLLGKVDGLLYGKTGYEDHAGYCLSVVYKPAGRKYYITTLGNSTYEGRNEDQKALYRYSKKIKK